MNYTQLNANNINGKLYVVEGDDAYLVQSAVNVFKSIVDKDFADINVTEYGGDVSFGELESAVLALPFMAKRRVIIVRDWEAKADDKGTKQVLKAIKNSDNVVVFVCDTKALPQSVRSAGEIVTCSRLTCSDMARKIQTYFSDKNVRMGQNTPTLIAEYTACDMGRVNNECEKLLSTGYEEITDEIVKKYVHKETDYAMYELTNAIGAGRKDLALSILKEISVESSPSAVLSVLTTNYKRVLAVAVNKEYDLTEVLGVKPYAVQKLKEQAQRFTQVGIKNLVDKLVQLEVDFKMGALAEENAMWIAIFSVFGA